MFVNGLQTKLKETSKQKETICYFPQLLFYLAGKITSISIETESIFTYTAVKES